MAAPAAALRFVYRFRDAKGQVGHLRVLIGDATNAAVITDWATLLGHLQAVSNAHVSAVMSSVRDNVYGAPAVYQDVVDKMALTFEDSQGFLHHFQVPAPIAAAFQADGETVNQANAAVAQIITDFNAFVFGSPVDTTQLAYVGGIRLRRKLIRKFNIFTLNPSETGTGE